MNNENSARHPDGIGSESGRSVAAHLAEALVPKLAVGSVAVAALLAALMQPPDSAPPVPQHLSVMAPVPSADSAAVPSGTDQP
jgi:hypothetical protein